MDHMTSLVVCGVLVTAAAVTGGIFKPGPWYLSLNKPWWTPPGWVFPLVWTILYAMIALAGWFVWKAEGFGPSIFLWGVGLIVNMAWSYIMFGQKRIGLALVDVALLWLLTAGFIFTAWNVDRDAAYLFVPYLIWVSIAAALNYKVWRLNPAQ